MAYIPDEIVNWSKLEDNTAEKGDDWTEHGGIAYVAAKFNDGADANPATDYLDIADFTGLSATAGCFEFWWKPHFASTSAVNAALAEVGTRNANKLEIFFAYAGSTKELMLYLRVGGTVKVYVLSDGFSWAADSLHHVAFVWDNAAATRGKIFFDGVEGQTVTTNLDFSAGSWDSPNPFTLGLSVNSWGGPTADSVIDNVKIWNYGKTDFSDREIEGFTPPISQNNKIESPLVPVEPLLRGDAKGDNPELVKTFDEIDKNFQRLRAPVSTKTTDYILKSDDGLILIDATDNNVTVTLPNASSRNGMTFTVKAVDITNTATVASINNETIDGSTSYVFSSQYESITVVSDGTGWNIT